MDPVEHWAHHEFIRDFVVVALRPKGIDLHELRRLHVGEDLTASQIAKRLGFSKTMILVRLRGMGLAKTGNGRSPKNYRYPEPAYGTKVVNGRLALFQKEMKVVRMIVEFRDRKKWRWAEIVQHLKQKGITNRRKGSWKSIAIRRTHKRWSGKI